MLAEKGFAGTYPEYYRGQVQVTVAEEHPFTIMEFDDFVFRIQFMVSECGRRVKMGRNCGFFRGRGRKSRIVREIR